MKRVIAGLLLTIWAQAGWCDYDSGNDLLQKCRDEHESSRQLQMYCLGYVASAIDSHSAWTHWGDLTTQICLPNGVSRGQLAQVVVKHLKERPEALHQGGGGLVLNALMLAFPCE
jgi:hypothetical protein